MLWLTLQIYYGKQARGYLHITLFKVNAVLIEHAVLIENATLIEHAVLIENATLIEHAVLIRHLFNGNAVEIENLIFLILRCAIFINYSC